MRLRSQAQKRPVRLPFIGALLLHVVRIGMVAGFILAIISDLPGVVAVLLGAAIFCAGFMLLYYGRRIPAPSAEWLLAHDPRPPVIHLRGFEEDGKGRTEHDLPADHPSRTFEVIGRLSPIVGLFRGVIALGRIFRGIFDQTLEEELSVYFSRVGPFVSIGRPGERLARAGAARLYVSEDQWQHVVANLVERARVVLLQAGTTPGVLWELDLVCDVVDPRKLVLIIPNPAARPDAYRHAREATLAILPTALPDTDASANFVLFDETWTPTLHPFQLFDPIEAQFYSSSFDVRGTFKAFVRQIASLDAEAEGGMARRSSINIGRALTWPGWRRVDHTVAVFWIFGVPLGIYQFTQGRSRFERGCEDLVEQMAAWPDSAVDAQAMLTSFDAIHRDVADLGFPFRQCQGKSQEQWQEQTRALEFSILSTSWNRLLRDARTGTFSLAEADALLNESGTPGQQSQWRRVRPELERNVRKHGYFLKFSYPSRQEFEALFIRESFEYVVRSALRERLSRDGMLLNDSSVVVGPDSTTDFGSITVRPRWEAIEFVSVPQLPADSVPFSLSVDVSVNTHRGRTSWDGQRRFEVSVPLPDTIASPALLLRFAAVDSLVTKLGRTIADSSSGMPSFSLTPR